MSHVTNVILLVQGSDSEAQRLCMEPDASARPVSFSCITDGPHEVAWIRNGKGPECDVYVGAFNYLDRQALLRDLESAVWRNPHSLQVLIQTQEDEAFAMYMFSEQTLTEVPLPGLHRVGAAPHEDGLLVRRHRPEQIDPTLSADSVLFEAAISAEHILATLDPDVEAARQLARRAQEGVNEIPAGEGREALQREALKLAGMADAVTEAGSQQEKMDLWRQCRLGARRIAQLVFGD